MTVCYFVGVLRISMFLINLLDQTYYLILPTHIKKHVLRLKLLLSMLHRELIKVGVLLSAKKNTRSKKKYSLHKKFFLLKNRMQIPFHST